MIIGGAASVIHWKDQEFGEMWGKSPMFGETRVAVV
jgi:hypothetical protein